MGGREELQELRLEWKAERPMYELQELQQVGGKNMINAERITETCRGCRYDHRSVLDEPCRTGIYLIHYSGTCMAYRPSLGHSIKELIRRIIHGRPDGSERNI